LVIALALDGPAGVLAGRAQATQSGRWKLRWQVLSLDGHITRGEVRFSVRELDRAR
jgi:methionine-rich copper-binding protein CopC